MSSPASSGSLNADDEQLIQLLYLGTLHAAANKTCKDRNNIKYASGVANQAASLPEMEKFFCKLAQICDTRKGGTTVTALVCLKGKKGPEYILAANKRKSGELKETTAFLSDLLEYVANPPKTSNSKNSDSKNPNTKPLQKQVLWRILEHNIPRLEIYLKDLNSALKECISDCEDEENPADPDAVQELQQLENVATFSLDLESSENSKARSLSDLETLIKAIHNGKGSKLELDIERHANGDDEVSSEPWRRLRHSLGRLHSYRQAADLIIYMSTKHPELFRDFKVGFIASARQKKVPLPRSPTLDEVLQLALLDLDLDDFQADIHELKLHGLEAKVREEHRDTKVNTSIHAEVHLHNYLVQEGMTDTSNYWNDSMFIASSKPTCRLCHYYFNSPSNDFRVQPPHMNLYYKWRLPEVDEKDEEALERYVEIMDEIIDQLQEDTLKLLKQKIPRGKRNDSRTDSHIGSGIGMGSYARSLGTQSVMSKVRGMMKADSEMHAASDENGDDWDDTAFNVKSQDGNGAPLLDDSSKWPLI